MITAQSVRVWLKTLLLTVISKDDNLTAMLNYMFRGRAQREVFRLLWGRREAAGSVSALARLAGVAFSAVHRELQAMHEAGLASSERVGAELHYRAKADHPHAD